MASELVRSATSSKLTETDWSKNVQIGELVARDRKLAKDVVKAIKKRLGSKSANAQLYAVKLLEMLMNNIGEPVHIQITETGILPILVKIVKKKLEHPVRERIFLLLDAAQTSVGGASGRFPQYYSAYYELVSSGVQFPDVPQESRDPPEAPIESVSDLSQFIQKARATLELLIDVLDTIETYFLEKAKDDFTLDLVRQCTFQKQRMMDLAVNSRNEIIVAQAVEINEQLGSGLERYDALLDGRVIRSFNDKINNNGQDEEEARRIRKGKASVQPKDDLHPIQRMGLMGQPIPGKLLNRPLIRPPPVNPPRETQPAVIIPPPPARQVERERFFQETTKSDGSSSGVSGRMSSLSLSDGRDAGSSRSGSTEFSDL